MILRATLSTLTLATLSLLAFGTSPVSATCIDTNPDDNGIGTQGCNLPVGGTCKVLVYGEVPGTSDCSPIVCVRECYPPYECIQDGVQNCRGPPPS